MSEKNILNFHFDYLHPSLRMNTDGLHHNCAQHRKVLMGETPTCRIVRYGSRVGDPQDRTAQHPCLPPPLPIQVLARSRNRRLKTECGSFNVSTDGHCTIMVYEVLGVHLPSFKTSRLWFPFSLPDEVHHKPNVWIWIASSNFFGEQPVRGDKVYQKNHQAKEIII